MKFKITQEHINKGRKGDSSDCAVALCIKDGMGNKVDSVSVDSKEADIYFAPSARRSFRVRICTLPQHVRDFIEQFDKKKKGLKPIEFELEGI